jgi:hypothetical protein
MEMEGRVGKGGEEQTRDGDGDDEGLDVEEICYCHADLYLLSTLGASVCSAPTIFLNLHLMLLR